MSALTLGCQDHIVRLVEYTPEYFGSLQRAALQMGPRSGLCHRPFVDYYYATREWCKLYLFLSNDQTVLGTIGVDLMRFEQGSREMTLGFASNFHALEEGVGGYLFVQWMKSCPGGIVFGGSADTHRILRKQKWTYYPGVKTYYLNRPYTSRPGEPWWRMAAKWVLRNCFRSQVSKYASRISRETTMDVSIEEVNGYTEDLLPRTSPFAFRFAPGVDYLNWRYNTGLSFVRYRPFRILCQGSPAGYVIINESPQRLIVSHCDGADASTLAYGVLLSLIEVTREYEKPRSVVLSSCHPDMQHVYERFGFKAVPQDRVFALGGFRRPVEVPAETSSWLVNYDWGDNGLRVPFLDQEQGLSSQR